MGTTSYDKAIATAIMSLVALGALIFHWSIPGWLTETNLLQIMAVVVPIIVAIVPNKVTTTQKAAVLATVGVTPAMAAVGVGTGGIPVDPVAQEQAAKGVTPQAIVSGQMSPDVHLQ